MNHVEFVEDLEIKFREQTLTPVPHEGYNGNTYWKLQYENGNYVQIPSNWDDEEWYAVNFKSREKAVDWADNIFPSFAFC